MSSKNKDYQPLQVEEGAGVVATAVEDVPSATATAIKATALPMIEVIAPATLSEGYAFEAEVGGRVISVTVVRFVYRLQHLMILCSSFT